MTPALARVLLVIVLLVGPVSLYAYGVFMGLWTWKARWRGWAGVRAKWG